MSLTINMNYDDTDNVLEVEPRGEIDIYSSPEFNEDIQKEFSNYDADILIDGKYLEYIDSTGLGALISIYKTVNENNRKIYLKNIKPNIRKLFDITDLDKIFIIKE